MAARYVRRKIHGSICVHVSDRLCRLRLRHDCVLVGARTTCNLIGRPLLLNKVWVLCGHSRHGLLARKIVVDLGLHQPVLYEERDVVSLVLERQLEHRHRR